MTEIGIEPTVRHGADLGFIPVVVTDGSVDPAAGERSLASLDYALMSLQTDVETVTGLLSVRLEALARQHEPAQGLEVQEAGQGPAVAVLGGARGGQQPAGLVQVAGQGGVGGGGGGGGMATALGRRSAGRAGAAAARPASPVPPEAAGRVEAVVAEEAGRRPGGPPPAGTRTPPRR